MTNKIKEFEQELVKQIDKLEKRLEEAIERAKKK